MKDDGDNSEKVKTEPELINEAQFSNTEKHVKQETVDLEECKYNEKHYRIEQMNETNMFFFPEVRYDDCDSLEVKTKLELEFPEVEKQIKEENIDAEECACNHTNPSALKGESEIIKDELCKKCVAKDSCIEQSRCNQEFSFVRQCYKCVTCGKIFFHNSDLKRHIEIHAAAEDKPFKCEICDKRFAYRSYLNVHLRIHIKCKICGRRFTQKIDLNRHLRIHSEDKPFKYDICGQRFI